MAEYELVESRTISGKGVLKIPADKKKNRVFILYADVVRPPKNSYGNFNYNPVRGKYGFLTFLREGYVINTTSIDYKKQVFDGVNDSSGQTLIAIKCMYRGIMDMFDRLENALVLSPLTTEDYIKDYENLRLSWDECRLVCYADTVISLRLMRLKYDTCSGDESDKDKSSPTPPPPPPSVPVGEPVQVDPPYDGGDDDDNASTGDDGNTDPYPGDVSNPCEGVGVWKITYTTNIGQNVTSYFKGKEDEVFYLQLDPAPGCTDGMGQNLYSEGVLVYSGFTCTSRATLQTFEFMTTAPSGVTVEPNPRYPGC